MSRINDTQDLEDVRHTANYLTGYAEGIAESNDISPKEAVDSPEFRDILENTLSESPLFKREIHSNSQLDVHHREPLSNIKSDIRLDIIREVKKKLSYS